MIIFINLNFFYHLYVTVDFFLMISVRLLIGNIGWKFFLLFHWTIQNQSLFFSFFLRKRAKITGTCTHHANFSPPVLQWLVKNLNLYSIIHKPNNLMFLFSSHWRHLAKCWELQPWCIPPPNGPGFYKAAWWRNYKVSGDW